jgi:pteridine reductase
MEIRGVPILVTGGSQRIGAACVRRLAGLGAFVVIHYGHSAQQAEALCREVLDQGGQGATVQAGLGQPEQVASLMGRAGEFFGPIRVLVNNAAIFKPGTFQDTSLAQWQAHLSINLTAPFILMQEFFRQLPPQTFGKIINLIDQRITRPRPGHVAYTTAKSGLATVTQIAAQEMAPWVQVNAIAPGPILAASDHPPGTFEAIAKSTPLARPGGVEDITRTLVFLLEQGYVTGEMIHVDGGEHLI